MQMRWVVMVGLMVLASARLAAHDFWLAATPWDPGAQVTISYRGENPRKNAARPPGDELGGKSREVVA